MGNSFCLSFGKYVPNNSKRSKYCPNARSTECCDSLNIPYLAFINDDAAPFPFMLSFTNGTIVYLT